MKVAHIPPPESGMVKVTLGGTVAAGTWIDLGNNVGCHLNGGVSGDEDVVFVEGVFRVTKVAGVAWVAGVTVIYLDDGNQNFTTVASTHKIAGVPYKNAASADTVGYVKLLPDKT